MTSMERPSLEALNNLTNKVRSPRQVPTNQDSVIDNTQMYPYQGQRPLIELASGRADDSESGEEAQSDDEEDEDEEDEEDEEEDESRSN